MKKLTLITLILIIGINFSQAQNDSTATKLSVEKLDFMVGEWEGTGWMMTRNGKEQSIIKEKAEFKLDKSIIVVEGLGTKTDTITNEVKIIHNAFGIIFFDSKNNKLSMNAYKNGESTQSEIEFIKDKVFQWKMEIPNSGKVRFTVDFSIDDKWTEIGEFSRDGINWMQFLGMELTRKKE